MHESESRSGIARSSDPQLFDRLFRMHERGLISDEELGRKALDELAHNCGFRLVEAIACRLPPHGAAAAEQYAREVLSPSWTTIVWGIGSAPTAADREQGLAALKQVAALVLAAVGGSPPARPAG